MNTRTKILLLAGAVGFAAIAIGCSSGESAADGGGVAADAQAGADAGAVDSGQIVDAGAGDTGPADVGETFPPESQTPFFEKGFILAPNSLPCVPVTTGVPQNNCNHHGSTIAELPDGTVAAVWFHGEYEKSLDSRNVWSRLAPGAAEWTYPEVVYDDPGRSEGNAALWVAPDGTLHVYFVTIFSDPPAWDGSKIRMTKSTDGGATWAPPVFLREEFCWMARHRPLRIADGSLVLPLYNECLAIPVFMYAAAEDGPWTEQQFGDYLSDYVADHVSEIQPALILRHNGDLVAYMRDGTSERRIHSMVSKNRGRNWTPAVPTGLPNSGTSIDAVRLLDGHVAVVYNNSPTDRFPLSIAVSDDEGETFPHNREVNAECAAPGTCGYHYPSIMQSRIDGTIWVSYTYNRETIAWIHTNEAWLRAQLDPINLGQ